MRTGEDWDPSNRGNVIFSLSEFLLERLVLAIFEGINGKTFEVVFPLYFVVVNCFGRENYRVSHAHTRTHTHRIELCSICCRSAGFLETHILFPLTTRFIALYGLTELFYLVYKTRTVMY